MTFKTMLFVTAWVARRLFAAVSPAAIVAALLAPGAALADDPEVPLEVPPILARAQAPVAVSADGHWQAFADAANVIHRRNLATGQALPDIPLGRFKAKSLVISGDGARVAWLTASGCIGFVEEGAPPRTTWLPAGHAVESAAPRLDKETAWPTHAPESCDNDRYAGFVFALSDNGRFLATPWEVIDLRAHRLSGRLPAERGPLRTAGVTLLLRFVDEDRRLLAVSRDAGRDDPERPPQTWAATWNLADGSLANLAALTTSSTPRSFVAYSDRTAQLAWTEAADTTYRGKYWLRQASATACADGAAAPTRTALPDFGWHSFVADPFGRWVAGTTSLASIQDPDHGPDDWSVVDVRSGRVIDHRELPFRFAGLVSAGDGRALTGFAWPGAASPPRVAGHPLTLAIRNLDDGPIASGEPRWPECRIGGERSGARAIERREHAFTLSWSRTIVLKAPDAAADPDAPYWAGTATVCDLGNGAGWISLGTDSTMWLDGVATIDSLDPATGRSLRTLPALRRPGVCSQLAAETGGFINAQGDTLSWRPLQDVNDGKQRRVIDVRPGWFVHAVQVDQRAFFAIWRQKAPAGATSPPERERVATYRLADLSLLRSAERFSTGMEDAEPPPDDWPACTDAVGPIESGFDFRIDAFSSYRARDCAQRGAAPTVFWSGLDLHRAWADVGPAAYIGSDVLVSRDGDQVAVLDDATVRVFDLRRRIELGQIVLPPKQMLEDVRLVASSRLLMLRVTDYARDGMQRRWDAYRID